jgi:ATP-dependent protease HslVU (ClpYQ) peptidase subunit
MINQKEVKNQEKKNSENAENVNLAVTSDLENISENSPSKDVEENDIKNEKKNEPNIETTKDEKQIKDAETIKNDDTSVSDETIKSSDKNQNILEIDSDDEQSDEDSDEGDHFNETDIEDSISAQNYEDDDLSTLIEKARMSLVQTPLKALEILRAIRPIFYDKYNVLKKEAINIYLSENEDLDGFVFNDEDLINQLNDIITKANEARREEKRRIEEEKQNNAKRKKELIAKLEDIVSKDETEDSINKVREIQKEWKTIKALPHSEIQPLWDKYTFLLDKFYDTHSINIELKELDRKKNLEAKIELVKKMNELHQENSLKKSFVLLRKYHEDFKNIGPVPAESREGLWQAFKAESDSVYEEKKSQLQALDAIKEENLKKKELLIEKISLVAPLQCSNAGEWREKTEEMEQIFNEWKSIGMVPKTKADEVWNTFKDFRNTFFNNKRAYFAELSKKNTANLLLKEDLCKQVEALLEDDNYDKVTKEIIKIQGQWKEIHTINNKEGKELWTRFRKACDSFFDKKKEAYKDKIAEENENFTKKREIVDALITLQEKEVDENGFTQLKELTDRWRKIGFVPRKKMKINEKYDKLCDDLFAKYKKNRTGMKAEMAKEHYSQILHLPQGDQKLKFEEQKLRKKIKFVQDEIAQMQNNMSFFSLSKGSSSLLNDFETKIEKSKGQLERLKTDLSSLRKIIKHGLQKPEDKTEKDTQTENNEG